MKLGTSDFVKGFIGGVLLSLIILAGINLYVFTLPDNIPFLEQHYQIIDSFSQWCVDNLGWSLIPFGFILVMYFWTLNRLIHHLDNTRIEEKILNTDNLVDIWISLFFGTGVIWTAIGMRSALLYSLGDTDNYGDSAIQVLQKLIEGGILTALTTTILGGAGGFLMRLHKTIRVGPRLNLFYAETDKKQQEKFEQLLSGIQESVTANLQSKQTGDSVVLNK